MGWPPPLPRSLRQIRKLLYDDGVVLSRSAPVTQSRLQERGSAGKREIEAEKSWKGLDLSHKSQRSTKRLYRVITIAAACLVLLFGLF